MYDKLGDLLNEALENPEKLQQTEEIRHTEQECRHSERSEETSQKSGFFTSFRMTQKAFTTTKKSTPTGQVIRRETLQLPPHILQALTTLELTPPVSLFKIKMQYRKVLKKYHPDTASTQTSSTSIDDIKQAYKILEEYYKVDSSLR